MKNDLTLNIMGFQTVNKDLTVDLVEPGSGTVVKSGRPFLDGTTKLANLNPGLYELVVHHPNLALPVIRRPIRVLPGGDTNVSVLIDPSKFRNTPIQDIPDANLGPVRDTVDSVAETVLPLSHKVPGESIRAEDWNAMASAIRDVAVTVGELTRLVTPTGHDHPELVAKFDEVGANFDTLLSTITTAMTELQRQIQAERYRKQITDVLLKAEVAKESDRAKHLFELIDTLDKSVSDPPLLYARKARDTGIQVTAGLNEIVNDRAASHPDIVNEPAVKDLAQSVELLRNQNTTSYKTELQFNLNVDRTLGSGAMAAYRK